MSMRLTKGTLVLMRLGGAIGIIAAIGFAEMAFKMDHAHTTMPVGTTGFQLDAAQAVVLAGACFAISLILILLGSVMDAEY